MSKTRSGIIYHAAEQSVDREIMMESETAGGSGSAEEMIRLLMEDRKRQDEQTKQLMRLMDEREKDGNRWSLVMAMMM